MTEKLETCRKAIEKFGIKAQVGMMHEEMCELGVALEHWKRDRCKKEDVVTEIADVMIVAAQMAIYFGKEEVDAEIDRKLERLEGKMKGESEDETIRKKMIEHFKSKKKETWCNMPIKSILAYLEKQKYEYEVFEPIENTLEYKAGFKAGIESEKQKEQKPVISDEAIRDGVVHFGITQYQIDYWLKKHVNVVEQKPAEWSEDWREEDIQTRFAFYTYKDDPSTLYLSNVFVEEASRNYGFGTRILRAAEKVAETIGATTISLKVKQDSPANAWYRKNGYGYVTFEDGYDWLEKNLEYLKPKKEVEWSEEDKDYYDTIVRKLEVIGDDSGLSNNQIKFLREHCPSPRSEWSEGDKKMLAEVIGSLSGYEDLLLYNSFSTSVEHLQKEISWLKSIRPQPHWKPSEEQMKHLERCFSHGHTSQLPNQHILESLYNDLSKL